MRDQTQQMIQTLVTIGCATLVAITAVIVAGQVATSRDRSWWSVLGGLAVCAGALIVAYRIFAFVQFGSWSY